MKILSFITILYYLITFAYWWIAKDSPLEAIPYGILLIVFVVAITGYMLREEIRKTNKKEN